MAKYKAGDRVRVRSWESMEKEFGVRNDGSIYLTGECVVHLMKKYCGKSYVISGSCSDGTYALKDIFWSWTEEMLEEEKEQSIYITRKDNEINAVLKENGKVVKRSKAICCEEDAFDFRYGSKLAIDRLFDDEKEETRFKPCLSYSYNNEYISDVGIKTNMTLAFGETLYTGDVVEVYDTLINKIIGEMIVCGNDFVMGLKGIAFKNGIDSSRTFQIRKVKSYRDLKNNQVVGSVIVKLEE